MRTLLFILLILTLIAGGLYWKYGNFTKGHVAPHNEWAAILNSTKWDFKYTEEGEYRKVVHSGKINFYDSTYIIHASVKTKAGYEHRSYGGEVQGNYYVNDGWVLLTSSRCSIEAEYTDNPEICKFYDYIALYNGERSHYELAILSFNKEKIIVEGKRYVNGSKVRFSFYKID